MTRKISAVLTPTPNLLAAFRKGSLRALSKSCVVVAALVIFPQRLAARPLISQMVHTLWRAQEGAPQAIHALAQGPDGILWLGTASGLYAFDGLSFSAFQSPVGEPKAPMGAVDQILVVKDGGVWVGFKTGQIVKIRDGRVQIYTDADGEKFSPIRGLQQAPDGTLFAVTKFHILRFRNDRHWHIDRRLKDETIRDYLITSLGTTWLATNKAIYRQAAGAANPVRISDNYGSSIELAMAEPPDGGMLIADYVATGHPAQIRRFDRAGKLLGQLPFQTVVRALLPDRDGSLWLGTASEGIRRVSWQNIKSTPSPELDQPDDHYVPPNDGTPDTIGGLLKDRDGNIWAANPRGLDRFKQPRVTTAGKRGLWNVCTGARGEIWLADGRGNVSAITGDSSYQAPTGKQDISSIACDKDETLWVVANDGLFHLVKGQWEPAPTFPRFKPYLTADVVLKPDGSVLLGDTSEGLWVLKDGGWFQLPSGFAPGAFRSVFVDSRSRVWSSSTGPGRHIQVTYSNDYKLLSVAPADLGLILIFAETSYGVFAGGQNGLAVSDGGDFRSLAFRDPALALNVSGLVEARNGDLWLIGSRGIAHVEASEVRHALHDNTFAMTATLIAENGIAGKLSANCNSTNAAALDKSGVLWFTTLDSVLRLDPENQPTPPNPPLLSILSMTADGKPSDDHRRFAPNPATLEIDYRGVNISTPEDVVYRYRLSGVDGSWQDAGHRAVAIYTHLRPGKYVFEVIASNGDGVWTQPTFSDPFYVKPSFYQTWWFVAAWITTMLAASAAALQLYLQTVGANIKAGADARADERIRIAQDIHDTLLQGVQGLLLSFHVAAQELAPDEKSRLLLERALSTADRVIVEGRNRVTRLRNEYIVNAELVDSLRSLGADLDLSGDTRYAIIRHGKLSDPQEGCRLKPEMVGEVYFIAREAVTNAFRHSGASEISLSLAYGRAAFTLTCLDNGRGFVQERRESAPDNGHWGIRGMVERSRRIGGSCTIISEPGAGTEVRIRVPAFHAYRTLSWLRALLKPLLHRGSSEKTVAQA